MYQHEMSEFTHSGPPLSMTSPACHASFAQNHVPFQQRFRALMVRNLLLKKRQPWRTILQIVYPLFITISLMSNDNKTNIERIEQIPNLVIDASLYCKFDEPNLVTAKLGSIFNSTWYIVNHAQLNATILNRLTNLIQLASENICPLGNIDFDTSFNDSRQFEQFYRAYPNQVKLAVTLDNSNSSTFSYSIRLPWSSLPGSDDTVSSAGQCPGQPLNDFRDCPPYKYYHSGFSTIQAILDSAIMNLIRNVKTLNYQMPNLNLGVFPQPAVEKVTNNPAMPFLLSIGFLLFLTFVPAMLVVEKEKRIKDAMYIMGLGRTVYWLAWLFTESSCGLVSSICLVTIVFCIQLIQNINPLLLYFLIQIYVISLIEFGLLCSVFFKSDKTASGFGAIFALLSSAAFFLVDLLHLSSTFIKVASIFSPFAFTYSIKSLINSPQHVTFSNLFSVPVYSFGFALVMLAIDCALYFGLVLFFDWLIGEGGLLHNLQMFRVTQPDTLQSSNSHKVDIEPVGQHMQDSNAIHIEHVSKVFDNKVTAVSDLSLDIYESQITAILGQNGAGKTTVMNMLVGALNPSKGRITIYGRNVHSSQQLKQLRTCFGVCFQEDILFDELTVLEHLEFYGSIKGSSGTELSIEINDLLRQVELGEQRHSPAQKLSGGEKRKLCILIALIGKSRVVFLDEPTSGVDAYSRHCIWTLLRTYKKHRVIILTTHFMDEADILSDRKAIMVSGKLRCVGSSLFLKNKFGVGYHLRVDIDETKVNSEAVLNHVLHSVSEATLDRETDSEMMFTLPRTQSANFPTLFQSLDQIIYQRQSGILDYGVSLTTLEDVFLQINECDETDSENNEKLRYNQINSVNLKEFEYYPNVLQKATAFAEIRYKLIFRDKSFIITLLYLIIFVVAFPTALAYLLSIDSKPVILDSNLYEDKQVLYEKKFKADLPQIIHHLSAHFYPKQVSELSLESTRDRHYGLSFENGPEVDNLKVSLIFNKSYFHSAPILQNALANALSRALSDTPVTIRTTNHILPETNNIQQILIFGTFLMMIQILLVIVPSTLAVSVVEDRSEKIKAYLQSNGLSARHYWMVTLGVHCSVMLVVCLTAILTSVILLPFDSFLTNPDVILSLTLLLVLYTPTSLLDFYVLTHLCDKKETAQGILPSINILISTVLYFPLIVMVIKSPDSITLIIKIIAFLWPFFVPMCCLISILMVSLKNSLTNDTLSYYAWESNIIPCYLALVFHMALAWIILPQIDLIKSKTGSIDLGSLAKKKHQPPLRNKQEEEWMKDEDVVIEEKRATAYMTQRNPRMNPLLVVHNLTKAYNGKVVVDSVNLVLESGEIFGLLGANGAGKTTTMRMIIREECETSGSLVIRSQVLKPYGNLDLISYCPQHNPFWPRITLGEYLSMFASLHGIQSPQRETLCQRFLQLFDIEEHADKRFHALSGGTKRKLCMLIAMMANRELTLLDEPSTGMDPKSKRFMWDIVINNFEPNGVKSAILTTHSMEEAEALCTRLAIMSKGSIRCLGSVQHLNAKYGAGYILELKWADNFDFTPLLRQLNQMFPHQLVREKQDNQVKIDVPRGDVHFFGTVFEKLTKLIEMHEGIEEFGFYHSSIEQVFIDLCKCEQSNET